MKTTKTKELSTKATIKELPTEYPFYLTWEVWISAGILCLKIEGVDNGFNGGKVIGKVCRNDGSKRNIAGWSLSTLKQVYQKQGCEIIPLSEVALMLGEI